MARLALILLDGWGMAPGWAGNIINHFNTPNFYQFWRSYAHASILPFNENFSDQAISNSGLAYTLLGTGRQTSDEGDELTRFFNSNTSFSSPLFQRLFHSSRLHIIGALDATGLHARPEHLAGLARAAAHFGVREIFFHLAVYNLPKNKISAYSQVIALNQQLGHQVNASIVSLFGADSFLPPANQMKNLAKILRLLVLGQGWYFNQSISFLFDQYYRRGFKDNAFPPSCLKVNKRVIGRIQSNDQVIIAGLTPQFVHLFGQMFLRPHLLGLGKKFSARQINSLINFNFNQLSAIFPMKPFETSLAAVLERAGKKVLKFSPDDNRFLLNFYFNGGAERVFNNEKYIFYPIEKEKRRQNILLGAERALARFLTFGRRGGFDVMILRLPNADILAQFFEINQAAEGLHRLDQLLGKHIQMLFSQGWDIILTAPFGNAEQMVSYQTGERFSGHTRNLVPFILMRHKGMIQGSSSSLPFTEEGVIPNLDAHYQLIDIAPTVLDVFGLAKPSQMNGQSLINQI